MILATFIAVFAAFNLSPRNDIQHVQNVPLAEGAITKFLVLHDAAVKYAKTQTRLRFNNPDNASYGIAAGEVSCTKEENIVEDEDLEEGEEPEISVSYNGELCPYLPIGYSYIPTEYKTKVFCLNSAEYNYDTDEEGNTVQTVRVQEGTQDGYDCNDTSHNAIYVVSFGQVPSRWRNVATNRIVSEFYQAMRSKIAVGVSCGIVAPKPVGSDPRNVLNSNYVIEGIDVKNNSIPLKVLQDPDFRSACDNWDDDLNGFRIPCIIYVTSI